MPKHTCGYLLQLRLIHSILHQATEGFANCVKFAIKLVCVWERKRWSVSLCMCTWRHTETNLQENLPDRHTHTHITTHKLQSVDVGKWYGLFIVWSIWLKPRFTILQKNPATFKEARNKPRGVSDPALCWRLLQKTVKTLTNWTPAVLHIFAMDNGRFSQSVPSPPLARREELEFVICHDKNFWHIQHRVNQCW